MNQMLKLKLRVFVEVALFVIVPYFLLEYFPPFSAHIMQFSFIDNYIPFNSQSIWLYQSLYLFIVIRTFTMTNLNTFIQYASMFTLSAALSFVVFFFYPTICPRPSAENTHWIYSNFVKWEKPLNAFPSMHVSLVLTTCFFTLYDQRCSKLYKLLGVVWTIGIIFSTLQSKQHVALDIVGGCIVTFIAYGLNQTLKPLKVLENRWSGFITNSKLKPI